MLSNLTVTKQPREPLSPRAKYPRSRPGHESLYLASLLTLLSASWTERSTLDLLARSCRTRLRWCALKLERQLGTIERGKRADFLLVDGDPTRDIGALRRLRLVMKEGSVVVPETIYTSLQVKPFIEGARILR